MPDAKLSALTAVSVPDAADLLYLVDVSDTTDDAAGSSRQVTAERLLGLVIGVPGGRLTTESGVAVSTSDRTSQSTLYYTPYTHNRISLYDGTRWKLYSFTERSLSLSSLTSGKNYDVFLYDNSGTLTLELSAAWTNDTTRADALTTQDGVLVKSGATTRRYLGTIRTTGTTTTEDSGGGSSSQVGGKRFVWNAYNQVPRPLAVIDTTDSWTYGSTAWRQANNASGNRVEYVSGLSLHPVSARAWGMIVITTSSNQGAAGVGVDSTTVNSARFFANVGSGGSIVLGVQTAAEYAGFPGIGYHALNWLESAAAATTMTFNGANAGLAQSGLTATVFG